MTRIRQDILNESVNVLKKLNVGSPKKQSEKGTLVRDYLYLFQSPPTFKRYNMGPAGCIRSYGALQMVVLNGQLGL